MAPLAARLDRFVRWFFNSSPSAEIEAASFSVSRKVEKPFAAGPSRPANGLVTARVAP